MPEDPKGKPSSDKPVDAGTPKEDDALTSPWMKSGPILGPQDLHLSPLSLYFPSDSYVTAIPKVTSANDALLSQYRVFEEEVAVLRKQVREQQQALSEKKISSKKNEEQIKKLQSTLDELRAKERIGFLLSRVNQSAQQQLLASDDFCRKFLEMKECEAFVMSVDIRRSTELMLRARTPEAFAEFITTLCSDLMNIITSEYGVFDKFTGDGVLAFFPDFFTGKDAAYYAVTAADRCHTSFNQHYQQFRKSFKSVLIGTGLGIGIDYGVVHLVQMAGGLTVVGGPVVYACRLSAALPGTTLVNQPAYEAICDQVGAACFIKETDIEIKHEGEMLAYEVKLSDRKFKPARPEWSTPREENAE